MRCDIGTTRATPPPKPASCDLDWGNAFTMAGRGRAARACVGDTTLVGPGQRVRILRYGTAATFGRFRCASATTGLTCRNRSGHGWTLSRQAVRLF